jgi:hypothetical protein
VIHTTIYRNNSNDNNNNPMTKIQSKQTDQIKTETSPERQESITINNNIVRYVPLQEESFKRKERH